MALLKAPELVLIIGPCGAGKTTYARAHYPDHALPSHEALIRALLPDQRLNYYAELRACAHRMKHLAVEDLLQRGVALCLTETGATRAERAIWLSLAQTQGARVQVIRLLVEEATAVARAQSDPGRPKSSRDVWPSMIARWFRTFEPVDPEAEGIANYQEAAW